MQTVLIASVYAQLILLWHNFRFDENRFMSPFEVEILGWKILAMAIEGVLFFILNFILDAAKPPVLR